MINMKFNYYYNVFLSHVNKYARVSDADFLEIYNLSLYDICVDFVMGVNLNIGGYPKEALDFAVIINTIGNENNAMAKSFIFSFNLILADYMNLMNMGYPLLSATKNSDEESSFNLIFDKNYKINECNAVNMNRKEEVLTLLKVYKMMKENIEGPIAKVRTIYRKDI